MFREEQFSGRRFAVPRSPKSAHAGSGLGPQKRKGPCWPPAQTTSPRGPRGVAHAPWRGGSATAGRREAKLTSGGGGSNGGGGSRRERRFRGRVAVRRRPRFPPPHDPLGECASPFNPCRVQGSMSGDPAAPA